MADNVVYLPAERRQTLGSDVGGLLGATIVAGLHQKAQQQQQQQVVQFMDGIRKAPDRAAAFEVMNNYAPRFKTPQDYAQALKMVDEVHPISESTPTPITGYSPDTGEPTTVFATRRDMLNPDFFKGKGVTLTKPDMSDFYQPVVNPESPDDTTFQHVGKLPVGRRPSGALTPQEIDMTLKQRADQRAGKRDERADDAAALSERRFAQSEERFSRTMGNMATLIGEKDAQRGQATMHSVRSTFALVLGAKALPDGSFDFGGDENKKKQYTDLMDYVAGKVEANPKILKSATAVERLSTEALRTVTPKTVEDPPPAAAPKPKEKGAISRMVDKGSEVVDKMLGKKPKDAAPVKLSPEDTKASVENAKTAAARIRASGDTADNKNAKLKIIRERLKAAGINEDI